MKTLARWRAGAVSHPGLQRTINEDRVWVDEGRGIFLVVDGLGGHAAGETAAAIATEVISSVLITPADIEAAISAANNEIYRRAEENANWRGMACVLTLAMMHEGEVFTGHVGDSRLYLFWNGRLQKMTPDHSPVGEQEDRGLLTEEQAMQHPRRNEVFRDVGSMPRERGDDQFIETRSFAFPEDGVLLLCSDGLTDCVTAREIVDILERYDGDPEHSAQRLVEAANAAGGKDNISVIVVAGAAFRGADSNQGQQARARHAATRLRGGPDGLPGWARLLMWLAVAAVVSAGLWQLIPRFTAARQMPVTDRASIEMTHRFEVSASDARGIIDALSGATSGDTILVPPGEFLGPLVLKEGVDIIAKQPRASMIKCDPAAVVEQGTAIVARGIRRATIKGLVIGSDDTHPLKTGVLLDRSAVELEDLDVSGAVYSGMRIQGRSAPEVRQSYIHGNGGAGITVADEATPKLVRNQILGNGLVVNAARAGIEIEGAARPLMRENVISGNGMSESGSGELKLPRHMLREGEK